MRPLFLPFMALLIAFPVSGNAQRTSGNPIAEGWYADPDLVILDGKYWIFPTYSSTYEQQIYLDAFSSRDLVRWQKHSRVVDTAAVKWVHKAMWAPCVVEKDGRYFLFFGGNDIQTPDSRWWNPAVDQPGQVGGIGVAVADQPQGPYSDYLGEPLVGEVMNGAQPIDQFVFEENGQYYLIYGGWRHCNIARLKPDFSGLLPREDGTLVKEITPEGYVEGPVMFKRDNRYYLMWSEGNWTDSSYQVAYGWSDRMEGPFIKQGVALTSDPAVATGAGHHSVLRIPGTDEWYIAYHRRPIPNLGRDHRVVCLERMYFTESGHIKPVKITWTGVEKRKIPKSIR